MATEGLEGLLGLFNIVGKRQVERYCRDLIIRSEDFANLLFAARINGLGPYGYTCHFRDIVPDHLSTSEDERLALARNGVGKMTGKALKASRKMFQVFNDRRLLAIHLFFSPSHRYWHMFYFDQRDYEPRANHWAHGPHIHYSQDTLVREPLSQVWEKVCQPKPELPRGVHIRYDYHHNRPRQIRGA